MKLSEATILLQPGFGGSSEDHWQSRWQRKLSRAVRVGGHDFHRPERGLWVQALLSAVEQAPNPVILIAHSLGVATLAHAAGQFGGKVRGAFLVGLPDTDRVDLLGDIPHDFSALPRDPLPFRTALIASRNDPYCAFEIAEDYAKHWGAQLIDAGESGHLNTESGHGPWPEGLLSFAGFVNRI
jgi:uncharacterized protein